MDIPEQNWTENCDVLTWSSGAVEKSWVERNRCTAVTQVVIININLTLPHKVFSW